LTKRTKTRGKAGRVRDEAAAPYVASRFLLDTRVWLWWQAGSPRLGAGTQRAITRATEVHFSIVSVWEIAIKAALGKLVMPPEADIGAALEENDFKLLPLALDHIAALKNIGDGHRDPFDRMLVAQATSEGLTLVTGDRRVMAYGMHCMDAAT
jgi:PIN domain nuclease of toxin-antitoxin system